MANRFSRELKLLFSFVKNQSQYEIPKITKELGEFQKQLKSLESSLNQKFSVKVDGVSNLLSQYAKLTSVINRAQDSLEKFNKTPIRNSDAGIQKQVSNNIKAVQKSYQELQGVIAQLTYEYKLLSKAEGENSAKTIAVKQTLDQANASAKKYEQTLNQASEASRKLTNEERKKREEYKDQFNTLGGIIKRQLEFVTGASIIAGTAQTVRKGFENTFDVLTQVQRILVVSRSDFLTTAKTAQVLGDTIEDFAAKTGQSVDDVSTILKELGSAGLTTEQSIAALDSTLNNIIGTDSSVVETTRLVASTFNILGNSITNSSDQIKTFTRINDIFARATNESSLELDQLVQALKFSLPASKEAGASLEELTAALSVLADQGIRGGNAGRAVRAALEQLAKDAPKVAKALNLKIDLTKPLDLLDVVQQFGEQIKGQEISAEQLGTIFERFGLRGADVFLLLAQNTDKLSEKIKDLTTNSEGAAAAAAKIRLESPQRQFQILGQNIAQLSSEVLKPFIDLVLIAVKGINKFADQIRLASDSSIIKIGLRIGAVTLALKGLLTVLQFVGPTLVSVGTNAVNAFKTLAGTLGALRAGASAGVLTFLGTIGTSLLRLVPVIGLVATAFSLLSALWETKVAPNSAILKKELDDQIGELQLSVQESKKLTESMDKLSNRVRENAKNFENGNITQEEFHNELNNIAQTTPQVARIVQIYGNNAEETARQIAILTEEQKRFTDAQQKILASKEVEKLRLDQDVAKSLTDQFKALNKEVNNLSNLEELAQQVPGINIGFSREELEKAKKDLETFVKENGDTVNKLIRDITQTAQISSNEEIKKGAENTVKNLKKILGDVATGFGTESNPFKDLIENADKAAKEFDNSINRLSFDIAEFKDVTGDATLGLKGLRNEFLFKFKVFIPEENLNAVATQLENLPSKIDKEQFGKNFINDLNISGITQNFQKQLEEAGFKNINFDKLQAKLSSALDVSTNKDQFKIIDESIRSITDVQIKSTKDSEKQNKLLDDREKLITQINTLLENSGRLVAEQVKSAELQGRQEIFNTLQYKLIILALKEASTIRGDVLEQAKFEESISQEQLNTVKKEVKLLEKALETRKLIPEEAKRLVANLAVQADLERKAAQARLARKKLEFEITNNLEESNIVLKNQTAIGSEIIDQDEARINLIQFEVGKLLKEKEKFGNNDIIIATSINKLEAERLGILKNQIDVYNNTVFSAASIRNQFEALFTIDQRRASIISQIKDTQLKILQLSVQIENSQALGEKSNKNTLDLINKRAALVLEQIKQEKELRTLDDLKIKNQQTVLELQKKINDQQSKLNDELSSRAEDPLRKSLEQFFSENDFGRTLILLKSVNADLTDSAFYFGDINKKTDLFIKKLREGKVDLSLYPETIQNLGGIFADAEKELQNLRQTQNEINNQKFDVLEKSFQQAVERGGQEGFDSASQILQELIGLEGIVDEKGRTDLRAASDRLGKIRELQIQLNDPAIKEKNVFLNTEEGAQLARTEIDLLTEAIQNASKALSGLNTQGDAFIGFARVLSALKGIDVGDTNSPAGFAFGGLVPGSGRGDTVPAMLEPGEFVIPRDVVESKGVDYFNGLIGGKPAAKFMLGGLVRGYEDGGKVSDILGGSSLSIDIKADFFKSLTDISRSNSEQNQILTRYLSVIHNDLNDSIVPRLDSSLVYSKSTYDCIEAVKGYTKDTTYNTSKSLEVLKNIETNTDNLDSYLNAIAEGVNKEFAARKGAEGATDTASAASAPITRALGGIVPGSGSGDIIPALLEPGEFVIPKDIVEKRGLKFFEELISDKYKFKTGGAVLKFGGPGKFSSSFNAGANPDNSIEKLIESNNKVAKETELLRKVLSGKTGGIPNGPTDKDKKALDLIRENRNKTTDRNIKVGVQSNTIDKENTEIQKGISFADKFGKLIQKITLAFGAYRKAVAAAGQATNNAFLQKSAEAADRFLQRIESIGTLFEELFTQTIPNFLGFFLSDVVESNIKILTDYQKVRRDIAKNYKDQRADLIEQLKRNEISYFDFFDKIEDLQNKRNDDEVKAEEDKDKAIRDQFAKNVETITGLITNLIQNLSSGFSDFALGFPALISPITDAFSDLGATVGGKFGDILGAVGSSIGPIVGTVLGAAAQVFGFAAQGFASLLPFVSRFVTLLSSGDQDFQDVLTSIASIPEEFSKAVDNIRNNIPKLLDALVTQGGLIKIGQSFADAIEQILPDIAKAFVEIIPAALFATIPIVTAIFDTFPDILASVLLSEGALPAAFVQLFADAGDEFLNGFQDNLPRIIDLITVAITSAISDLSFSNLSTTIGSNLVQGLQQVSNTVVQSLTGSIENISNALASSDFADSLISGIVQNSTQLSTVFVGAISNAFENSSDPIQAAINRVIDSLLGQLPEILDKIPGLINEALTRTLGLGNLVTDFVKFFLNILSSVGTRFPEIIKVFFESIKNNSKEIAEGARLFIQNFTEVFKTSTEIHQLFQDFILGLFKNIDPKGILSALEFLFTQLIPELFGALKQTITPELLTDFVVEFFKVLAITFTTFFGLFLTPIQEKLFKIIDDTRPRLQRFIDSVLKLGDALSVFVDFLIQSFGSFIEQVSTVVSEFLANPAVSSLIQKLSESFGLFVDKLVEFGSEFINKYFAVLASTNGRIANLIKRVLDLLRKSGLVDIFVKSLTIFLEILIKLADVLDPLVNELMPLFEVLLTVLAFTAIAGVLAVLVPLIVLLTALVDIIDALNKVAEILAPILGPLAPILDLLAAAGTAVLIALGVGGLLTILILLLAPIILLIAPLLALAVAIIAVKAAVDLLTPVLVDLANKIGTMMDNIKNVIDDKSDDIVTAFENILNQIIDKVNAALGITSDTGNGSGSNQSKTKAEANKLVDDFNKATGSNVPHLAKGGLVFGRAGTDNISIKATAGEYVLKNSVVKNFGKDFLDRLNSSDPNDFFSYLSTLGVLGKEFNGRMKNRNDFANVSSGINSTENANTRDYYLKNFYSADGFDSSLSSGLQTRVSDVHYRNNDTNTSSDFSTKPTAIGEPQPTHINLTLDFSGANFTSEETSKVVKESILMDLENDSGELIRKIKEKTKR